MRLRLLALTVTIVTAASGSHVSYAQDFDIPTTGEVIGGQIGEAVGQAIVSVSQGAKAKHEMEAAINRARRAYFECYPNCPELETTREAYARELFGKDLINLYKSLGDLQHKAMGGQGQSSLHALEMIIGEIDGGIYHGCRSSFHAWATAVYEEMGGGFVLKTDKLQPAIEANRSHYANYVDCRDKSELEQRFGFVPSDENPRLRRSALVAIDGNFKFQDYDSTEFSRNERASIAQTISEMADSDVKVLMCEYGPFENSTGSAFFKPYKIREAWYKSPPTNQAALHKVREHPGSYLGGNAMACCPGTNNDFLAVRTGAIAPPSCEGSAAPPAIRSSLFFWQPKGGARLSNFGTDAEGKVVCSYRNGETVKFDEQQLAKVLRGKCPPGWAPEFPVDYEILSSSEIRYTYTNGESIIQKNRRNLADYWVPDETRWWRLGDPSD